MKKEMSIVILFFIMYIFAFAEKISISAEEYPPYVIVESKKYSGIMIDIVREACKYSGVDVEFLTYPTARGIFMVKEGLIDGIMPKYKTQERAREFSFSDSIVTGTAKFIYIKGRNIPEKFQWEKLADFTKYKVGGTVGYWYIDEFKKAGVNIDEVVTNDQNIKKLYAGRIDTFVIDEMVATFLISKYFEKEEREQFAMVEKPEKVENLYLMAAKENSRALEKIKMLNSGIKKLKETGEYEKIILKYKTYIKN